MLVKTDPPNDALLHESPAQVVLHFSEPVETAFGSVRIYDSNAHQIAGGKPSRPAPDTVAVRIGRPLTLGTYTVAWRVISADSHPVHGAFVFHLHVRGPNPSGVGAQVLGAGTPRGVSFAFAVVRFFDFGLLLLCVGGASVFAFVIGGPDARGGRCSESSASRPLLSRSPRS